MLYNFLLFTLSHCVYALPRPDSSHKSLLQINLIPPLVTVFGTDLESIVTARAFTSSLFTNLRNEITGDRLFLQLYSSHSDAIVYISMSLIVIYGEWKFYQGSQSREKLQKIDSFNKKETFLKNLIFIILFVFTKDVLSAT